MVEWETVEITTKPLKLIASGDPVTCALYDKTNNILKEDGWMMVNNAPKRKKKLLRINTQAYSTLHQDTIMAINSQGTTTMPIK